jgi:hypothetical protein
MDHGNESAVHLDDAAHGRLQRRDRVDRSDLGHLDHVG